MQRPLTACIGEGRDAVAAHHARLLVNDSSTRNPRRSNRRLTVDIYFVESHRGRGLPGTVELECIMSLSQAFPDRAGGAARSLPQSWEAPVPVTEKSDGGPTLTRGVLTFAGAAAFLRRNSKKIGSLALILFIAGIAILQIIPVRYAATALVLVDPRELHVTADQDVLP
jgi:hypothetical protein